MKVNIYNIKNNGKRKYAHFDKRLGLKEVYKYISNIHIDKRPIEKKVAPSILLSKDKNTTPPIPIIIPANIPLNI